ncbi:MAG: Leu/Phe/Val dehydrogenase [Gammaproteobacteria bacterium]
MTHYYDIFDQLAQRDYGDVHFFYDKPTQLRAVIAIHSTKLGPALGGCRCIPYNNTEAAVTDALRLARGMSYKAAISGLPLGGGKGVIMAPPTITNHHAFFEAFGRCVHSLNGRYITANDSGTVINDMDVIAKVTPFVATHSGLPGLHGANPGTYTAMGVKRGMEAAVKQVMGKDTLNNCRIAVQGLGAVGYDLVRLCHEAGAHCLVTDIDNLAVQRCVKELGATAIAPEDYFATECDILAPCALGGILNDDTIPQLRAPIVAGSANNQLGKAHHGATLQKKGILYAPDYVINAGGLIHACSVYFQQGIEETHIKINGIYDTLLTIFAEAEKSQLPTNTVADHLAQARIA